MTGLLHRVEGRKGQGYRQGLLKVTRESTQQTNRHPQLFKRPCAWKSLTRTESPHMPTQNHPRLRHRPSCQQGLPLATEFLPRTEGARLPTPPFPQWERGRLCMIPHRPNVSSTSQHSTPAQKHASDTLPSDTITRVRLPIPRKPFKEILRRPSRGTRLRERTKKPLTVTAKYAYLRQRLLPLTPG